MESKLERIAEIAWHITGISLAVLVTLMTMAFIALLIIYSIALFSGA